MFVQVIQGTTHDREGLRRQMDRWTSELRPGAEGFLGSTGGVTADGDVIAVARFESAEAARRNSDRPDQSAWWEETAKFFDGDAVFHDSEDVDTYRAGGSDAAGFVQVMQGRAADRDALRRLEARAEEMLPTHRPDLIGSVRCWYGSGDYTEVAYFTSEAEAREGEAKAPPPELADELESWTALMGEVRYLDLTDPWLIPGR